MKAAEIFQKFFFIKYLVEFSTSLWRHGRETQRKIRELQGPISRMIEALSLIVKMMVTIDLKHHLFISDNQIDLLSQQLLDSTSSEYRANNKSILENISVPGKQI